MAGVTLSGGMMGNGAMLCGIHQWFIRTDDYGTAQSFLEAIMDVMIIATKACTHRKHLEKELESLLIPYHVFRGRLRRPYPKVGHPAFAKSGGRR